MATVQCTGCGRAVDTRLIVCPDCGTPVGYLGGTPVTRDLSDASSQLAYGAYKTREEGYQRQDQRPHCFEHPDLSREADMRLHAERFSKAHDEDSGLRESRLGLVLVLAGLAVLAGLLPFLTNYRDDLTAARSQWPTVQGTVLAADVYWDDYVSQFKLEFAYQVDGTTYYARQSWPKTASFLEKLAEPMTLEAKHWPGTVVTVYYDPTNPAEAQIQPRPNALWFTFSVILAVYGGGGAIAGGIILMIVTRLGSRKRRPGRNRFTPREGCEVGKCHMNL